MLLFSINSANDCIFVCVCVCVCAESLWKSSEKRSGDAPTVNPVHGAHSSASQELSPHPHSAQLRSIFLLRTNRYWNWNMTNNIICLSFLFDHWILVRFFQFFFTFGVWCKLCFWILLLIALFSNEVGLFAMFSIHQLLLESFLSIFFSKPI